jgi:murein DD-endopeptidase MepM/ murein hydrolase activator NlpD
MTVSYAPQNDLSYDEGWYAGADEWAAEADYWPADFDQALDYGTYGYPAATRVRIEFVIIPAVLLIMFLGTTALLNLTGGGVASSPPARQAEETLEGSDVAPAGPTTIVYPYDNFALTQGPHGFSYGHMAIDIAAGKGASVKSPIEGKVSDLYVDEWGNTTLVIENSKYQVTMLHGNFSVAVGDSVSLGQQVGIEGNNGYTLDAYGNSCRGRDCGYHTHLNVFDKELGTNVNPLEVLSS